MCRRKIRMAAALDGFLGRRVEPEPGEGHVIVARPIRAAGHVLNLHRGDVADFRTDADRDPSFAARAVHPLPFCMDQGRTGHRLEPAELHVSVSGKVHPRSFEQANDLVEMRLRISDGQLSRIVRLEDLQLLGRTANRRVRPVLQRDHTLHCEGSRDAHGVPHDLRLVHQLLGRRIRDNALVHLVHLRTPRDAIGGQCLTQGFRPVRVRVERNLPLPPPPLRNLLPVSFDLSRCDCLQRSAGRYSLDPAGRRIRQ